MTIKPFAIQGADLTLGGVNLQAGTTGVVIPGVTQAVNYRVEEVQDVDGNNPDTFGSDTEAVLLLDNAAYLFRSNTETPSGTYSEAGYSVQELDDGAIEEIAVEVDGVFTSTDKAFAEAGNMWASTVADAKTKPQFDTNDWTQIPFRPRMRADEVEAIGGGGVAEASVSYKGFKAVYARMYDAEPTISKVLIYQDTVTSTPTIQVDPETSDDLFKVSGLADSSIIALLNIYGADDTFPTPISNLEHFVKSIVDDVILNNGQAGNVKSLADMKFDFYDRFDNFASRAGERYKNFRFTREEWLNISSTVQQGTGAVFDITNTGDGTYQGSGVQNAGTNYLAGHKIKILGTSLGGATPTNDCIITVDSVGVGGTIFEWSVSGTAASTGTPTTTTWTSPTDFPGYGGGPMGSGCVLTGPGSTTGRINIKLTDVDKIAAWQNLASGTQVTVIGTGIIPSPLTLDLTGVSGQDGDFYYQEFSTSGALYQDSVSSIGSVSFSDATPTAYTAVSGTNYNVGSGATFNLYRDRSDDTIDELGYVVKGTNYQVNDIVKVLSGDLDGTSPDNDIVITVTAVGEGGRIEGYTYNGMLPHTAFPFDNIEDGGTDQYDGANYIYTNIQGNSREDSDGDNNGQWALHYNNGNPTSGTPWFGNNSDYVVVYNDSIFGLFVTGANINWIATDGNSGFDGDGQVDTGSLNMSSTDGLINGDQIFTLNANGSVTFPDGTVQSTAYTEGDGNVWIQNFETVTGSPADVPAIASSVEYLDNGDIVALFTHFNDTGYNNEVRYNSIARLTPAGEKVWSMSFTGARVTDGWGLAVSNDDYIYVAGSKYSGSGYEVATLTKLTQSNGTIVWSKTYDVGVDNSNFVVDVGYDGHPVVVGYADTTNANQIVTTKIESTTGAVLWSRSLDGQGYENAYGMAVGRNSNNDNEVVTVGYLDQFGPSDRATSVYSDPSSNPLWTIARTGVVVGGTISFDVSFTDGVPTFTNVVDLVGNRTVGETVAALGGAQFGGEDGEDEMVIKVGTVATDYDDRMLVVKYNSNGNMDWQKAIQVDAGFNCRGADADIDSDGNIYVSGTFDYAGPSDTNSALMIIKFNYQGVKKWVRKVQGPCEDFANSIVVGPDDSLYLSAFTANGEFGPDTDYGMVVAKYNLDGTVAWQRVLDSNSGSTFAGSFYFGPGMYGGSSIAVRSDYVTISGGFVREAAATVNAIVAQFGTDGKQFTVGDYDFESAGFSGLLNTTASNITVVDAALADSDYAEEYTVGNFEPTFNLASDLVGTVYRSINPGNELRNGNYFVSLNATGSITLPAGGKISEAVVTSNPTIQLTPARPDVASQKLVIKGGGTYYFYDNNIDINYYSNILNVNDTLTIDVNSSTYANQTLYWWIYPENAGIGDSNSGSLALDVNGNGQFTILIDSDDYEFRVRVSPENGQYDPANVGVQSGLINSDSPTFDSDHHLHLTTGNLAETSIFLGTDNHNVRTTNDGGIQVTTQTTTAELPYTITISGADVGAVNLVYTRNLQSNTPQWDSPLNNLLTDPYIRFLNDQWELVAPDIDQGAPVYINTGTLTAPLALWEISPPYGSSPPLGVYTYLTPDIHAWQFGIDGTLTLPGSYNSRITEDAPGVVVYSDNGLAVVANAGTPVASYAVEFTGYIDDGSPGNPGATLHVTAMIAGTITDGMTIYGAELPPEGWVANFMGGSGGVGTYLLANANLLISSQSFNNGVYAPAGPKTWIFDDEGEVTFPDNTVQKTAYPTGQQTVYVNAGSTTVPIEITGLTGSVIVIEPEAGYTTPAETHTIELPIEDSIPRGTKITIVNTYNGTVVINGWPAPGFYMGQYFTIDLVYIQDSEYPNGYWWVTNSWLWD